MDRCQFHFDDAGRFHLHLTTDKLTGDVIEQALVEARDRLFVDGHRDLTWTDAARAVCQRSLDAITDPGRRNRYRLNYHLDHTGRVTDPHGWCLPDAIARHLTCDGLWTPTFTNGATPVSVGRSDRIVPDRTRRLVEHRDQGCRVPGCTQTRWLDVHHIIHWLDLGPTDTWNLICLCPHHHRLHHQAKLGITGNADHPHGVVFTNLAGNPIAQTGAKPTPPTGAPPPPIGTYHHPLGERLDTHWLHFNPPPQHHTTTTTPHAAPPPGGDS